MAIPTADDLVTMDYVYHGGLFVELPAKSTIDLTTMDYVYLGQPFVRNSAAAAPPAGFGQVI